MLLGPRIVSKYSQHPIARLCKLARLALLLHCSATTAHGYPFHHPGKWSKSHTWAAANYQEPAVHMVLLPGDSTHSNVLWWRGDEFTTSADFDGALLRWNPPIPAEVEPNVFPTGKIVVGFVPTPDIDIFCGGQAHLPDGRVIIMGGNETGEIGLKKATVFNPFNIASPWQSQPDMSQRRWYPTALTLPTNKTLVLSGNQYHHMDVLGGFTTGGATGDSLRRLGMASNATWDPGVVPDAYFSQRPSHPDGFSMVSQYGFGTYSVLFGGRTNSGGQYTRDLWTLYRNPNESQPDYQYGWVKRAISSPWPSARAHHSVVAISPTELVLVGGVERQTSASDEVVVQDVWYGTDSVGTWKWQPRAILSTSNPGPLFGHQLGYDPSTERVYMYGGRSALTGNATDAEVWSFRADSAFRDPSPTARQCWWTRSTVSSTARPSARFDHSFSMDPVARPRTSLGGYRHRAFLFGGRLVHGGTAHSDTLWQAWFVDSSTVEWTPQVASGTWPVKRFEHSAVLFQNTGALYLAGGQVNVLSTSIPTDGVYVTDVDCGGFGQPPCETGGVVHQVSFINGPSLSEPLAGHRASHDHSPYFARQPELYDPATSTWTLFNNSGSSRLQEWYPQMFVLPSAIVPGNKVFAAGPSLTSLALTISGGNATWASFPADSDSTIIRGGSAVQFRPGKILKVGTRDTEGGNATAQSVAIDFTGSLKKWRLSTNAMGAPRVNHNLVLLPSGEVLAVGGTRKVDNQVVASGDAVFRPELFDPEYVSGERIGRWYGNHGGTDTLAPSTVQRDYHSTALLLPDARVLCASGNASATDRVKLDIYSPPYLYKANGVSRSRPTILGMNNGHFAVGDTFSVVVDSADVEFVLIRAGAVTHGFDAGQNFVPLSRFYSSQPTTTPPRVTLRIPGAPDSVPPGPYMLFALTQPNGTPSVARWVTIGTTAMTDDWGDRTAPAPGSVLTLAQTCPQVRISWAASSDDSSFQSTGAVRSYEMRYSTSPILSWAAWDAATPVTGLPAPASPGTYQDVGVPGLSQGVHYYFRLVAYDNYLSPGNRSLFSNQLEFTVPTCGGGSGGGGGHEDPGLVADRLSAQRVGSSTPARTEENTLLDGVAIGSSSSDLLKLASDPRGLDGAPTAYVRYQGSGSMQLARLRIVEVSRRSNRSAFVVDGAIVTGALGAALELKRPDGTSPMEALCPDSGAEWTASLGDTLVARLDQGEGGVLLIQGRAVNTSVGQAALTVQGRDGAGWGDVAPVALRGDNAEQTVVIGAASEVRLVATSSVAIRGVRRVVLDDQAPTTRVLLPIEARHTSGGAVDVAVIAPTGNGVLLGDGDSLRVRFEPSDSGAEHDYFLDVGGHYLSTRSSGATRRDHLGGPPTVFALRQNVPNPFAATTRIEFDLPVAVKVRLEIFDLQGRRVRTLVNQRMVEGRHSVAWDRRNADGGPLRPGVYLYRLTAGSFVAERKLIGL